jgi:RNA recognition motif-containing protein
VNDLGRGSGNYGGHTPHQGGGGGSKGVNKPKRGPTIYVQAQAQTISDAILRQHFEKFGEIVAVKMNNPAVGFVTFDKVENAEYAVQEVLYYFVYYYFNSILLFNNFVTIKL